MTSSPHGRPDAAGPEEPSVLVVDDDERLAALLGSYLDDEYDVTVATGGEAALEVVDESVDVVLLDRRMPGVGGDAVLDAIRRRNLGCRVAMVTAVEPDLDIIEMPFDDYVVKPVSKAALRETVERLLLLEAFGDVEYELSSLRVKKNVLAAELTRRELRESEEFARLEARIEELRDRLSELRGALDDEALAEARPV